MKITRFGPEKIVEQIDLNVFSNNRGVDSEISDWLKKIEYSNFVKEGGPRCPEPFISFHLISHS